MDGTRALLLPDDALFRFPTLKLLLPQFQGLAVTEAGVDDLLDTLLQGLVAWQLAHSEPWYRPSRGQALTS